MVLDGPTGPLCAAGIDKAHCGHALTPLSSPVSWPALVGRDPTPVRCLPANRLLDESFVSNDSSPWPNGQQQSHSDRKHRILMLKYLWPTTAVSPGLGTLDLSEEMFRAA